MEAVAEKFDRVLFPCQWNAETYRNIWRDEVYATPIEHWAQKEKGGVVPHALCQAWWSVALSRSRRRGRPEKPFTFLWVGTWTERKNPIGVLQAYFSEFRASENVLLKIVTPSYPPEDVAQLRALELLRRAPRGRSPRRRGMRLTEEEMRDLYLTCGLLRHAGPW